MHLQKILNVIDDLKHGICACDYRSEFAFLHRLLSSAVCSTVGKEGHFVCILHISK